MVGAQGYMRRLAADSPHCLRVESEHCGTNCRFRDCHVCYKFPRCTVEPLDRSKIRRPIVAADRVDPIVIHDSCEGLASTQHRWCFLPMFAVKRDDGPQVAVACRVPPNDVEDVPPYHRRALKSFVGPENQQRMTCCQSRRYGHRNGTR
jgi:hypothetical protein